MKKITFVILCCFCFFLCEYVEQSFANDNIFIDIGKNEKVQIIQKGKKENEINAQKIINNASNKIFKELQAYQALLKKASQVINAIEKNKEEIIKGTPITKIIKDTIGMPKEINSFKGYDNDYEILMYGKIIRKDDSSSFSLKIAIPTIDSLEYLKTAGETGEKWGRAIGGILCSGAGAAITAMTLGADGGMATVGGFVGGALAGSEIGKVAGEWIGKKIGNSKNPKYLFNAQYKGLIIWIYEKKFDRNLKAEDLPKLSSFCFILAELIPEFKSELQTLFTSKEFSEIELKLGFSNLFISSIKSKFTSKELNEIKQAIKVELSKKKLSDLREAILTEIKNV